MFGLIKTGRWIVLATVAFGLSGCISVLGSAPAIIYDLSPKSTFDEGLPLVEAQLVIEEPTASRAIDSNRIAVREGDFKVTYFEEVRWSDRSTLMFQTRLIESFENSGKITAVGRKAIGLLGNYDLLTELREFQAQKPSRGKGPIDVLVAVNGKLIAQPKARIVASRTFRREVRAESERFDDIIAAYDEALGGVLKDIVSWTLKDIAEAERLAAERLEAARNGP